MDDMWVLKNLLNQSNKSTISSHTPLSQMVLIFVLIIVDNKYRAFIHVIGVLGNSGQRMRFKFLKDDDLDPVGKMIIHTPLRNYFAVQASKNNDINL